MKKKIFGGVAAIAIAAIVFTVTAYGGDTSTGSISTGKDDGIKCYNTITTNESKMVLYCGTCTFISGDSTWSSGTGKCPNF
jgi:hypothetical protein